MVRAWLKDSACIVNPHLLPLSVFVHPSPCFLSMYHRNSYHGTSPYSQGLTGLGTWKYPFANGFGIHNVCTCACLVVAHEFCVTPLQILHNTFLLFVQTMNADVYRGPWGGSNCRDSPAQTLRTCNCQHGNKLMR